MSDVCHVCVSWMSCMSVCVHDLVYPVINFYKNFKFINYQLSIHVMLFYAYFHPSFVLYNVCVMCAKRLVLVARAHFMYR